MQNRDPLTYRDGEDEFRPLFKRILMTLPAPLGLGPAMEALRDSHPAGTVSGGRRGRAAFAPPRRVPVSIADTLPRVVTNAVPAIPIR